jgi:hypothetical protein
VPKIVRLRDAGDADCEARAFFSGDSAMHDVDYFRDQAITYRAQAAKWRKDQRLDKAAECQELAETCELVAAEIEDRLPAG